MTTYYLDPENGNDANTGISFAQRRRTYAGVNSTLSAGDIVRVIADYGQKSLGNMTWTNNSRAMTLATAVTQTIENFSSGATTGWVMSTAATVTNSTSVCKMANALQFAVTSSFAGGLVAYKALGSALDLSAFQSLSAWVYPSVTFGVGVWKLALCSDAAGAVPVVYHDLSGMNSTDALKTAASAWHPQCVDSGAALPSGINSIALYCTTASTALSLYLNNWIAATAKTASNHLSHECVIGKNTTAEPEWYSMQIIDGTAITLGGYTSQNTSNVSQNYQHPAGTTETVATYAVCPLKANLSSTGRTWPNSSNGAVTVSGGWDRTAMSTQSGTTWLNGSNDFINCWNYPTFAQATQNWTHSNFGFIGFTDIPYQINGAQNQTFDLLGHVSCKFVVPAVTGSQSRGYLHHSAGACTYTTSYAFSGTLGDSTRGYVKLASFVNGFTAAVYNYTNIGNANHGKANIPFTFGRIAGNNGAAITTMSDTVLYLRDTWLQNNTTDISTGAQGEVVLDNVTWSKAITGGYVSATTVRATNNNGSATDHSLHADGYVWTTTATTQSGSGVGWQVKLLTTGMAPGPSATEPAFTVIDKIAVNAGALVTYKRWVYVSNANMSAGLSVDASGYFGLTSPVSVAFTGTVGAWQQLTLTFTPTAAGVIPIKAWAWNSSNSDTTSYASFSDMTVSQ